MKISSFPPFFHLLPHIFEFFLDELSYLSPNQPITHNFFFGGGGGKMKNIDPWTHEDFSLAQWVYKIILLKFLHKNNSFIISFSIFDKKQKPLTVLYKIYSRFYLLIMYNAIGSI